MTSPYTEWHFHLFAAQYGRMITRLLVLLQENPDSFAAHPEAKFFKKVRTRMDTALGEPGAKEYEIGNTLENQCYDGKKLGKGYSGWRRIKNGMPDRYRLFFQFSSPSHELVFAWLNDERSIRRAGHKNDVYAVFARLLASGTIPTEYRLLREQSSSPSPNPRFEGNTDQCRFGKR